MSPERETDNNNHLQNWLHSSTDRSTPYRQWTYKCIQSAS